MEPCRKLFNLPLIKQKVKRDCFEITQPTNREDYFTTPFGTRNVGDLSRVRFYHLSGRRIKAFFLKYNYVSLTYAICVYFPKQSFVCIFRNNFTGTYHYLPLKERSRRPLESCCYE
jgi:hypothetical protein